jgi:hypothetical protein
MNVGIDNLCYWQRFCVGWHRPGSMEWNTTDGGVITFQLRHPLMSLMWVASVWPRPHPCSIPTLTFGTGVLLLIQINHHPDAKIFQFIILTFVNSSTCFGRFPAHQERNDCSGSLWFYLRIVVIVVLCSWSGRPARAATAVIELLMMGGKMPETCWAVNKHQYSKLKNSCIRLVIYLNCAVRWCTDLQTLNFTFKF